MSQKRYLDIKYCFGDKKTMKAKKPAGYNCQQASLL